MENPFIPLICEPSTLKDWLGEEPSNESVEKLEARRRFERKAYEFLESFFEGDGIDFMHEPFTSLAHIWLETAWSSIMRGWCIELRQSFAHQLAKSPGSVTLLRAHVYSTLRQMDRTYSANDSLHRRKNPDS